MSYSHTEPLPANFEPFKSEVPLFVEPSMPKSVTEDEIRALEASRAMEGNGRFYSPQYREEQKRLEQKNAWTSYDPFLDHSNWSSVAVEEEVVPVIIRSQDTLTNAQQRGDIHPLGDVSFESLVTMLRSVEEQGTYVVEKYQKDPKKVAIAELQLRALIRNWVVRTASGTDAVREKPDDTGIIKHSANNEWRGGDTQIDVSDGGDAEASAFDKDLIDTLKTSFTTQSIDSASYIITSLSLMRTRDTSSSMAEQEAADMAFKEMHPDPEDPVEHDISLVVNPEQLRRVKLAGTLGSWASSLAAETVKKRHLDEVLATIE